jgi:hypothetical protein
LEGKKKASLSATAKLVNHIQQVHAWVFVSFVLDMVDDKLAGFQYSNNAKHITKVLAMFVSLKFSLC